MDSKKNNLTDKRHWDSIYRKDFGINNWLSNYVLFRSYYHFALFRIIGRYIKKNHRTMIEIGCAPGNYLIKFKDKFKLEVFGVEYSRDGHKKTIENVSRYGIFKKNIYFDDFFNSKFLTKNSLNYDIVFSAGFIEHFENPKEVIRKQIEILKAGGMLICIIPNKKYINAFFTSRESLAIHNLSIMNKEIFCEIFNDKKLEVKYCDYSGGLLNFGLYQPSNFISKIIFFAMFFLQRVTLDNFEKIYFFLTKRDLTCKYTSPSLLCVAKKINN